VFPADTFRSTPEEIIPILESLRLGFHLTGGITSVAYAEPRMTQDAGIVIDHCREAPHQG
jgi:hypothetical protein